MNRLFLILLILCTSLCAMPANESVRKERRAIAAGNKAYGEKNYTEALSLYNKALAENPASLPAKFNLGLAKLMIASSLDPAKKKEIEALMNQAKEAMTSVASHYADNPSLASRANYNLGNVCYNAKDYQGAIDYYKQALRLDPGNNSARKNLRLAQLKIPKNNNQDDKKENKDKQNQQDNQDKKQNQDKKDKPKQDNQDKNKQDEKQNQTPPGQQKQQQPQGMSNQAADRILKHNSDKEKQTMRKALYGKPQKQNAGSNKRW